MKPVCEIIVQYVLPGIRSMIALKLIKDYGLSQKQAAEILGTTQPAISQYKKETRGRKTQILARYPKILETVDSIAKKAAHNEITLEEITQEICTICKHIRKEGIIYEFYQDTMTERSNTTVQK